MIKDQVHGDVKTRVEDIIGQRISSFGFPAGGFSQAIRFIANFENHFSVFVKVATDDKTASALRVERKMYSHLEGDFLPKLIAWQDDPQMPILILEDLSHADWYPIWSKIRIKQVLETLKKISSFPPPSDLPRLENLRNRFIGWSLVAEDPTSFLSLGLCTPNWLDTSLPILITAEEHVPLDGSQLVHFDVRSDNMCFIDDRTILTDWDWACVGNPIIDIATWLPGLHLEGGPHPFEILPNQPEIASWLCGCWAARAGLPASWKYGAQLRALQLRQLKVVLPWAIEELGLKPLTYGKE